MWVKKEIFERQQLHQISLRFYEKCLNVGDWNVIIIASMHLPEENRVLLESSLCGRLCALLLSMLSCYISMHQRFHEIDIIIFVLPRKKHRGCQKHGGMRGLSLDLSPWSHNKLSSCHSSKGSLHNTQRRTQRVTWRQKKHTAFE